MWLFCHLKSVIYNFCDLSLWLVNMRDVLIVANKFGVQFVCVNQFKLISESILKLIQRFACLISQITFMLVYVLYMCHDKWQHLL